MRVLLSGASGQLGPYVHQRLIDAGHEVLAWSGRQTGPALMSVNLADPRAIDQALQKAEPDVIVHLAAVSSAEGVRNDPIGGRLVNVKATAQLADWCGRNGRKLIFSSTDLVFDGRAAWTREDAPVSPVLEYGRTKAEAEPYVTAVAGGLVARISLLYGPSRSTRPTYLDRTIDGWRRGEPQTFFEDEYRTPLDLATAAEALTHLTSSGAERSGLVHLAGRERLSRFEHARRVAEALGFDPALVRSNRQGDANVAEPRPADVSLDTKRLDEWLPGLLRPTVVEAVGRLWGRPARGNSETRTGSNV